MDCANVTVLFYNYIKWTQLYHFLLLGLTVFCWYSLTYFFIYSQDLSTTLTLGFFPYMFRKVSFRPVLNDFLRSPREARFVKEGAPMNFVKGATKGAYSPGHPLVGEVDPNDNKNYRVDGSLTHGKGTVDHPSSAISLQGIPPDNEPTNFVPLPEGSVLVPLTLLHNPILNLTNFLEKPENRNVIENAIEAETSEDNNNSFIEKVKMKPIDNNNE